MLPAPRVVPRCKSLCRPRRLYNLSSVPAVHLIAAFASPTVHARVGALLHHITIAACDAGAVDTGWADLAPVSHGLPCPKIVYAYDKGARLFELPAQTGVRLGAGSPLSFLLVEWHFNLPGLGLADPKLRALRETSSVTLTVTPRLRRFDAAVVALADVTQALLAPAARPDAVFASGCGRAGTRRLLAHDLHLYGEVYPVAVHLHAHSRATKLVLELWDGDSLHTEIGRIEPYGG